jgi:hypothetical protein
VLLIRLSLQTLTEALRKLWPHLLNELISVFEARTNENGINDRENTDLIIEAIKLVELLSSLNIEDFQMNQWIFLIDGYGMKEIQKDADQVKNTHDRQPGNENAGRQHQTKDKDQDTEAFKTFIIRFIGGQEFSFYNVDKPHDGYGDSGALDPNDPQDNDMELLAAQGFGGSDEDDQTFKPQPALPSAPPLVPPLTGARSGRLPMQDPEQTEDGMLSWHALALQ